MQDVARYAVGIDIGSTTVHCVIGRLDPTSTTPSIVGVSAVPNNGMRKGVVVNIVNVAQAIDRSLEEAERMSAHRVEGASVSINGSHISAISSKGVIAVSSQNHEIMEEDLIRVQEAATVVQLPANREILQVTPRTYQLDGQDNIKDPLGMSGIRLEVDAHVITALTPHVKNLMKAVEMTETHPDKVVVACLAASRAVLNTQQMENGVAVVDLGGTTTSIAVYEEGDLQHLAVLPIGSVNITNDLAIGLRTDLDIAESIKLKYAHAMSGSEKSQKKQVELEVKNEVLKFNLHDIDMIVEARLDEIFELVDKELKQIDRSGKLPGGLVLTGGGANMQGIAECAKDKLRLPARIADLSDFKGISEKVMKPEFATALGLMLSDFDHEANGALSKKQNLETTSIVNNFMNRANSLFKKFKS